MTMHNLGTNSWPLRVLHDGWNALRDRTHQALTYFSPKPDEHVDAVPRWGLLATDVVDHDTSLEVRMEVPGMEKADISVDVIGRQLTVSGEKRSESTRKDGTMMVTERAFGQFRRSLTLPEDIVIEQAKANYDNGVLMLTLPKSTGASKRKVSVTKH